MLALHLSKELCRADEDGEQWLQVVRKLPVLPSVLSALELSLRCKQNLYFTEAALHLLLTLARTPQVHTAALETFIQSNYKRGTKANSIHQDIEILDM